MAFLDISKVFDTVNRDRILCALWDSGVQDKAWRLIQGLYKRVENKVIFGSFGSSWYECIKGVKQGCILSPKLFSVVMDDLLSMLQSKELGIMYKGKRIPALLYADDIVLMAEIESQLKKMFSIADHFVKKCGIEFNSNK